MAVRSEGSIPSASAICTRFSVKKPGEFKKAKVRHRERQRFYEALRRLTAGESDFEYVTLTGKRLKCVPFNDAYPDAVVSSRRGPSLAYCVFKDGMKALTETSSFFPKKFYCSVAEIHERKQVRPAPE